jgi:hypothetical protein
VLLAKINTSDAIWELAVPPLTLWKGAAVRTNDYKLFDRLISEEYRIGGTEFLVHKYLGPKPTGDNGDFTLPNTALDALNGGQDNLLQIQDVLNMEIRDRAYDQDVIALKGHYQISDTEFDLRQFGLFLSNETIFITFHLNDMVNSIGRTLMSGDVIEISHRRDDLALGDFVIPKYYVVQEGARPAEGYSPTWWPHMWRVKCDPITDSQEYRDILQKPAQDLNGDPVPNPNGTGTLTVADMVSVYNREIEINDRIVAQATVEVPFRNLQAQQFYVLDSNIPVTILANDGIPPNQSKPVLTGITFPPGAPAGTWILRVDYSPPQLYERKQLANNSGAVWTRYEIDYRTSWTPSTSVLAEFINNATATSTLSNGVVVPQRQDLRTVLKAKLDPDII